MLEPLRPVLSSYRIILASGSPRRREILSTALPNFNIEIKPSNADENLDRQDAKYKSKPWLYAEDTALLKAEAAMKAINADEKDKVILIGADTVVTFNNEIYGKPKNDQDAVEMLRTFSGQSQTVYSGVCIFHNDKKVIFSQGTEVTFDTLSPQVIDAYVASGEPKDKAGGYGIQGIGGTLISGIKGDYFNVVGFPLHRFCKEMGKLISN